MKNLSRSTIVGLSLTLGTLAAPYVYADMNVTATESTGQYVAGSALTAKVKAALLATKGLYSNDIQVTTLKDVVILEGIVDNKAQVELAVRVASGVSGVAGVHNKLVSNR